MITERHNTCDNLNLEQSCITIDSYTYPITFYYQSTECYECDFKELTIKDIKNITIDFVQYGTKWKVTSGTDKNATICRSQETYFTEGSFHNIHITNTSTECPVNPSGTENYIYMPLLYAVLIYSLFAVIWKLGQSSYSKRVWNKMWVSRNSLDELTAAYSSSSVVEESKPKISPHRLRSLDTVRGISIVLMIFVNYGGGKYWFFHHAPWNGLTFADLVFPWFIWMMGMSLALSLKSLLKKKVSRKKILLKICKRSIILFSLGLMLNTYCTVVKLNYIRISGVLQRFSVCYLVVAGLHLFFAQVDDVQVNSSWAVFRDIFIYWIEWIIMLIILAMSILITFLVHSPDCPKGYLGPGGLHESGKYENCTGGAAGYIDRTVLSKNHLYMHPDFKGIYETSLPYDPEGILGYLTSIFLVFLGLQAGKILLIYKNPKSRIIHWLSWSLICGSLSLLLSCASKNEGWIPINKNMWSVSFIFATASLAFLLMSICYYVIDIKKWWTGAPFFYAGMNSILLYVGHEITHKMFPWSFELPSTHAWMLAIHLWGTTLWVIIAIWAYNIDFFVTV